MCEDYCADKMLECELEKVTKGRKVCRGNKEVEYHHYEQFSVWEFYIKDT